MSKTPIDRLVEALRLMDRMQEAVARHDRAIDRIVTDQESLLARLDRLETRLDGLENDGKA